MPKSTPSGSKSSPAQSDKKSSGKPLPDQNRGPAQKIDRNRVLPGAQKTSGQKRR